MLPEKSTHPTGETELSLKNRGIPARLMAVADVYDAFLDIQDEFRAIALQFVDLDVAQTS